MIMKQCCIYTQSNNSANLIRSIVHDDVIAYLDARNIASYPGTEQVGLTYQEMTMTLDYMGLLTIILGILILMEQMTGQEQFLHWI